MIICPHCQTVNDAHNPACVRCGAPLGADPVIDGDPFVGRQLGGRFTLQTIIGSGEIGMVYRGVDARTNQPVAVKIVHPDVASTHGDELLKSARAIAQLRHAKIAAVIGAAREADGTTFIVTEFLKGETLKALLERTGPMGPRRAADILFQLCSALAPIHRAGRPHANLKPENVFLLEQKNGNDFVKIVDVGSPELFGVRQVPGVGNVVIGSAKFFSPEQATGQRVGLASDQFTLGIVGYQLLTGALPFFGATPDQLLTAIAHGQPTPVGERTAGVSLPAKLEEIIHRCLAKSTDARYPDLRSLATDLAAVIKSTQPAPEAAPRPKRKPFGAGRDLSTVVAGPDMLASLGEVADFDDEDDEDRTVMRSMPEDVEVAVGRGVAAAPTPSMSEPLPQIAQSRRSTPPRSTPPPMATSQGLQAIPEPLAVTGAIDSDDLAAALADAAAAVGGSAGPNGATSAAATRAARPTPRPAPKPAPADDLAAALADAARDLGADVGSNGGFDPFGGDDEPEVPPPRSAPPAAAPPVTGGPRSSNPNLSNDILSAIGEELESVVGDSRPAPPATAASPLATAADFQALTPGLLARAGGGGAEPAPPVSARRSGGKGKWVAVAILLLAAAAGGGYWFLTQGDGGAGKQPVAKGRTPAKPEQPPAPPPVENPEAEAAAALAAPFTYTITSDPPKAAVFLGEERLGETPLDLKIDSPDPRQYLLKLEGHADLEHGVDPSKVQVVEGVARVDLELQPKVAKLQGKPEGKGIERAAGPDDGAGTPKAVEAAPKPKPKPKPKRWKPRKKPKKEDIKNPFD